MNLRYGLVAAICALSSLAAPLASNANPTLSFSWDDCAGPVHRTPTGPGTYSLYVSVTGMNQPHAAYEAWFHYSNNEGSVPDAWRFDNVGCQGSAAVTYWNSPPPPEAAACPPLHANHSNLSINAVRQHIAEDPPQVGPGENVIILATAYNPDVTSDPNQRYFLFRVDFDHTSSVEGAGSPGTTCGGFEQEITIRPIVERCNYLIHDLSGAGIEVPFDVPQESVTFGGGIPTPAATATWGQIKNQYRR